jgi:hypothetical protein
MPIDEIQKVAERVAMQGDRVLFITTLIVLGGFCVYVMRYFLKQYEDLMREHKSDQESNRSTLARIVSEQNETAQRLAVVLDRNTVAITQNSDEIRRCNELREERIHRHFEERRDEQK